MVRTTNIENLPRFTLKKTERLSQKKIIQELFQEGSSFFLHPFKVFFMPQNQGNFPTQFLISVPKKIFKTAVTRNKIKRRVREAYRLNKHQLITSSGKSLFIAYIYVAKEVLPFEEIQLKLIQTLIRLKEH